MPSVLGGLGSKFEPFPFNNCGPDVQDDPTVEHLGTFRLGSKVATTSVGVGGKDVGWLMGDEVGELVGKLVGEVVGWLVGNLVGK